MRKMNKKGSDLVFPIVIFLVLNIAFFVIMMLFVQRVSSSAMIFEEAYAKKIGLLLNRAEPEMKFEIDVSDLVKVALKNGIEPEHLNRIINIDTEKGKVFVRAKQEGGFNYHFFSEIKINQNRESPTTRLNVERDKNDQNKVLRYIYIINIE